MPNPTHKNYNDFVKAYDFLNRRLFSGELPPCLITMQRKNRTYGYFSGDRWKEAQGETKADEIALNPEHFQSQGTEEVLSTLAHEMVHLWQFHFGRRPQKAYHDKQWANKMKEIGLIPSSTGKPGGKETGQKMSDYIEKGGRFEKVCAALIKSGFVVPYLDQAYVPGAEENGTRTKKAASKTKYTCTDCGLNAWAKPDVSIFCGECNIELEAQEM